MKKFLLLAAMGVVFVPTVSVFAQQTAPTSTFDPVARCEAMVERSQERSEANGSRHTDNAERLNKTIEKLEEFIQKVSAQGIDTSALETDIETLKTYSSDLNADYQAVQDNLLAMSQIDCETITTEEYQSQIANAKSLHEALRGNVSAIVELRITIKTHVQEIIAQIISQTKSLPDSQSESAS